MEAKKTLRERMSGENRPDFARYKSHEQVVAHKQQVIDNAWDLVNRAEEDAEPLDKIAELRRVAIDQLQDWRKYITLSERYFKHDFTVKKAEVIALTMAAIPDDQRDELVSWFFRLCDRVKRGKTTKSGRVVNLNRFNSLKDYIYFCETLEKNGAYILETYPQLNKVMEELGL